MGKVKIAVMLAVVVMGWAIISLTEAAPPYYTEEQMQSVAKYGQSLGRFEALEQLAQLCEREAKLAIDTDLDGAYDWVMACKAVKFDPAVHKIEAEGEKL